MYYILIIFSVYTDINLMRHYQIRELININLLILIL